MGLLLRFSAYQPNRSQKVVLQGSTSHSIGVSSGIPQGLILGPLMFILTFIRIFNLPLSPGSELKGYAEDVTYYKCLSSSQGTKDINSDLEILSNLIEDKGLRLNLNQVKAMLISRKKSPPQPTILLRDHGIEYASNFTMLCVITFGDLSWRAHILVTISKARRLVCISFTP